MKSSRDYTLNKKYPLSDMQNETIEFLLQRAQAVNAAQTGLRKNLYVTYCSYNSNVAKKRYGHCSFMSSMCNKSF